MQRLGGLILFNFNRSGRKSSAIATHLTIGGIVAAAFVPLGAGAASANTTQALAQAAPVGLYENTSLPIRYSGEWTVLSSSSDSGKSSSYTNLPGSASLTFSGSAVRWTSRTTPSSGIAYVSIDGVRVATVDRYSAQTLYKQTVFQVTGLSAGIHTITIQRSGIANAASTGKNLLIDSITVIDTTAPAQPTGAAASMTGGQTAISWLPVPATDLAGYRVYQLPVTGSPRLIGWVDPSVNSYTVSGEPGNTTLRYLISAVDTTGNESLRSAPISVVAANTPVTGARYAQCPAATVTVKNSSELLRVLPYAKPGSVIRLAPGSYTGQIKITANGTADKPIWICGPRDAVINVGSISAGHGFLINGSSHLIVTGMTVSNGLKGVAVLASRQVTISDMLIQDIGYEGIHLQSQTTDSTVVGNTVRRTGRLDAFYGEGIYIGSSKNNWCALTACLPDRSDRNAIIGNMISESGSQLIDAKEGTTGGVIRGNILNGAGGMTRSDGWVMVMGNGWSVTENVASASTKHGFQVNGSMPGWGLRNLLANNTGTVNATGFGFDIYELSGLGSSNTLVSCANTITAASSGFANVPCIA